MSKKHYVIVISGLSDGVRLLQIATNHWRKYGLEPLVYSVGWRDKESQFQQKLENLVGLIDRLAEKGNVVSLVGTSAGGSAALNTYVKRRDKIHKIINVCGRLRTGPEHGFRSFRSKTGSSPAFAQSVKLAEVNEATLGEMDRKRIMTVRSMLGDELVPANTTTINGAHNITVPMLEHGLSIGAALTVFSKPLIMFLIGRI